MDSLYRNRREAGKHLATRLREYRNRSDVLVLGLPRGGVPVAYEVAHRLNAPLDVFVVRKLGVPGQEELAMGAVARNGTVVLNETVAPGVPAQEFDQVLSAEKRKVAAREKLYRGTKPFPDLRGLTVILVDDGLATGASMKAAVAALRNFEPTRIVAAVPVAPEETCAAVRGIADDCVCAVTPRPFFGVGTWFEDFSQTTDEEVTALLNDQPAMDLSRFAAPSQDHAHSAHG